MSAKQKLTALMVVTILSLAVRETRAMNWFDPANPEGAVEFSESVIPPDSLLYSAFNRPPCFLGVFEFDVMLWDRTKANQRTLQQLTATGASVLDADDLEFPIKAGFRLGVTIPSPCGCDFQFKYFGANDSEAAATRNSAGTEYLFFQQNLTPANPAVTTIRTVYESRLTSLEFNIRSRQWEWLAPVAGVRYFRLDDGFNRFADTGETLTESTTANDLWGIHLGFEMMLWQADKAHLEMTMKGAILSNTIAIDGDSLGSGVMQALDRDFSHSAFAGELGFSFTYDFDPRTRIRVGYHAVWLEGVALGPDQMTEFNLLNQEGDVSLDQVFYHGTFVGVEFTL